MTTIPRPPQVGQTNPNNQSTSISETIAFQQFAQLAARRIWTVDELAKRFDDRIERPTDFFNRVLSGKFKESVIPYRSVIEFYQAAVTGLEPSSSSRPTCACGCGQIVFRQKKMGDARMPNKSPTPKGLEPAILARANS